LTKNAKITNEKQKKMKNENENEPIKIFGWELSQETDLIKEQKTRLKHLKQDLKQYGGKLNENSLLISIDDLDLHRLFRENKELYHRCQMFGCGFQLKLDLR
jgi:hypothetical protein